MTLEQQTACLQDKQHAYQLLAKSAQLCKAKLLAQANVHDAATFHAHGLFCEAVLRRLCQLQIDAVDSRTEFISFCPPSHLRSAVCSRFMSNTFTQSAFVTCDDRQSTITCRIVVLEDSFATC